MKILKWTFAALVLAVFTVGCGEAKKPPVETPDTPAVETGTPTEETKPAEEAKPAEESKPAEEAKPMPESADSPPTPAEEGDKKPEGE